MCTTLPNGASGAEREREIDRRGDIAPIRNCRHSVGWCLSNVMRRHSLRLSRAHRRRICAFVLHVGRYIAQAHNMCIALVARAVL